MLHVLLLPLRIAVQYISPLKPPVYACNDKFCYLYALILERKIKKETYDASIFNGAAEGAIQLNLKRDERRANKFE